jgi:hypothetical protein
MPPVQHESPGTVLIDTGTGVEVANWPFDASHLAIQRT